MLTVIAITALSLSAWTAVRSVTRMRRLEEAVISQQERLLHLTLYLHWVEENALALASSLHELEDILAEDYPELIQPPQPDYPTAYDKWGEFDV